MNKKAVSINNRQDGVPTQDQPFHENPDFKWHDFFNMDMPPPGYLTSKIQAVSKLKIRIDAPDQLYYYLGEPSTDAKCFFTDKPGSKEIVPKANFMDRVQSRTVHQYQAPGKQVLAAAPAAPIPRQSTHNTLGNVNIRSEKPYVYKPKEAMQPSGVMWGVDQQALANQRSFLAGINGRPPSDLIGMPRPLAPQYNYQGGEPAPSSTPLRSFPDDHYYSMKTLPAAYPGEHSVFKEAARRESQGAQTMHRPNSSLQQGYVPNYQSVKHQQSHMKQSQPGAPIAPMMGNSSVPESVQSLPPNPYATSASRPSSSTHSHPSPYGAPLTPATTHSTASASKMSDGPPTDAEYLASLQKYPYLLNSYCRKPKVYESPYLLGGGFSAAYQPLLLPKQEPEPIPNSLHTPHGSLSSGGDAGRRTSQQWTPPSQMWDKAAFANTHTPQYGIQAPQCQPSPRQYPQPTYSTPAEFQRQIQPMPSTASRDGAQARMLRDQGYAQYPPHPHHRNSFGQSYDTARMWNSPKAPTPSPLSDPNTPGQTPMGPRPWGALPRADVAQMMPRQPQHNGYGSSLPQMQGGNETWRYN